MKLKSIKLAGFKSFVEPTTITFPSRLVAIVGPNGCGKSNIIDAVRWVLGESSAKSLRGELISDVIFNGSVNHAPLGQASIELLFDNSDGRIGGEYASYTDIAVCRKVTRDGASDYFLNGKRCRRRDIVGLFLGTGLGPRSYAIIEQGMISRLIESKPEELRGFLEEAAGISKYKERRRETENRMRHTQENLDRLTDVRDELQRQLQHLQRQAKAAERYTTLKKEERLLKAQCQALQWGELDGQVNQHNQRIRELDVKFEAVMAELHAIDAKMETCRQQHGDKRAALDEIQTQYYNLGTTLAQTEQAIESKRDKQQQLREALAQIDNHIKEAKQHLSDDNEKKQQWSAELTRLQPEFNAAQAAADQAAQDRLKAEEALQDCQQQWDAFNQRAAIPRQRAEVQQAHIQQLEQVLSRNQQHCDQLETELNHLQEQLATQSSANDVATLATGLAEVDKCIELRQQQIEQSSSQLSQQRAVNTKCSADLDQARHRLQQLRSKQVSLEALQQAAMGQNDSAKHDWLQNYKLDTNPRLATTLKVKQGWEKAVEMVLGDHLQAVCIEGLEAVAKWADALKQGTLSFFDQTFLGQQTLAVESADKPERLASKLESGGGADSAAALLANVYATDDLSIALAMRSQLLAHESVVTRDDYWLGPNWLRITKDTEQHTGFLKRQQALKTVICEVKQCESKVATLEAQLSEGRNALHDGEKCHEGWQLDLQTLIQQRGEYHVQLNAQQLRLEQQNERQSRLTNDLEESRKEQQIEQENLAKARTLLQEAIDLMDTDNKARETLLTERDKQCKTLEEIKQAAHQHKEAAHQLALRIQSLQAQLHAMERGNERTTLQLEQWQQRKASLLEEASSMDAPLDTLKHKLEEQLKDRLHIEETLITAKRDVDALEHQLRDSHTQRRDIEQRAEALRTSLEKERVQTQGVQVSRDTIAEQLSTASFDVQALLQDLPDSASPAQWQNDLQAVEQRIARLGAINLAAIEEYNATAERKNYLDKQCDDVSEALETLKQVIHNIDEETKQRLKETFDKVNSNLQELFPKVFGGGKAYLDTTSSDLLNTGIAIMAQPPGKRNTTIHGLSGGEKALTAIAMVFALFRLNPTPFCILDEVDAPLDDANVERYANLVKDMSKHVQFIYITHNKIAMGMAEQLMGVTMHEPGVSRLVAVDIDKAAAMAEA